MKVFDIVLSTYFYTPKVISSWLFQSLPKQFVRLGMLSSGPGLQKYRPPGVELVLVPYLLKENYFHKKIHKNPKTLIQLTWYGPKSFI